MLPVIQMIPLLIHNDKKSLRWPGPTVASLQAQYQQVITAYKATRVAFAIEGDALSSPKYAASVVMRDLAIARLKSGCFRERSYVWNLRLRGRPLA